MKHLSVVIIAIAIAFLAMECTSAKNTTTPAGGSNKAMFDYPEDMVADTAKKRFEKEFRKGSILYNLNCAKCHNVNIGGEDIVPDFSLPQLMDYELRIQYPSHGDLLRETTVTHDELEWIVLYLRYKKKSNHSINEVLLNKKAG